MNPSKDKTPNSLSSQQRAILLQSLSNFLQLNGFSKTLQSFRKEAHFDKVDEESCLINIEEMCNEYLKSRNGAKECIQEQGTERIGDASEKNSEKMKENGGDEGKKSEPITENGVVDGANSKSKKKKKSKSTKGDSEQVIEEAQPKPAENPEETPVTLPSEPEKKPKDKKKKHSDELKSMDEDLQEKQSEVAASNLEKKEKNEKKEKKKKKVKNGSNKVDENVTDPSGQSTELTEAGAEKKESKKRKKPSYEENDVVHVDETLDGSKRRKTDNSGQSNGMVQPPKTPNDGSAEPKTAAKAFQRVKAEEVEFADERLQDNSYWAKGGADSGYGAKAQEILGQVRGRDFRHEKTKKKRGSYRGGLIDLNTHSVKFNYNDDDE